MWKISAILFGPQLVNTSFIWYFANHISEIQMHLYNPIKASKILLLILSMSPLSFLLGIYFCRPS